MQGGWYYTDDGQNRYNPTTDTAQYKNMGGVWTDDAAFSTNPAYKQYQGSGGLGLSYHEYQNMLNQFREMNPDLTDQEALSALIGMVLCVQGCGNICYQDSELPEWDWSFGGSVGYAEDEFAVNNGEFSTEEQSFAVSAKGSKGPLSMRASLRREHRKGEDNAGDSQSTNVLLMPGYTVMEQAADGVTVNVYGSLSLGYVGSDDADDRYGVTPGFAAIALRGTPVGVFAATYSFGHYRNLSDDDTMTGNKYINFNGVSGQYAVPVTETLFAFAGLDYAHASDTPAGVDNSFTTATGGVKAFELENWDVSLSVFRAVDDRDTQGFEIGVGYRW